MRRNVMHPRVLNRVLDGSFVFQEINNWYLFVFVKTRFCYSVLYIRIQSITNALNHRQNGIQIFVVVDEFKIFISVAN